MTYKGIAEWLAITLTTGIDTGAKFTGTAGADTFTAVLNNSGVAGEGDSLNAGDSLTGGDGIDTLSIVDSQTGPTAVQGFFLNGVEKVSLQNVATGLETFDMSNAVGLTTVALNSSNGATKFDKLANIVDAEITSSTGATETAYVASVVAGSADTAKLKLNAAGTTAAASFTADGIETIAVTTTGAASGKVTLGVQTNAVTLAGANVKQVTVAGDKDVALVANLTGATNTATTAGVVDASNLTGSLDIDLSGTTGANSGTQYLKVTAGKGADTVRLGSLNQNQTVAGGDGVDTLVVNALTTPATDFKNVTGFEKVQLNTGVTGAINLAAAGAITDVTYAGTANAADLQGVASGINVNYLASAGGGNTIQIANAAINSADVLNITLGSAAHTAASGGAVNANTVTAANVETINLTSSSKAEMAGADHQIALNAAGLKTLTIQGNESLVINANAATTALTSVDASKATANVNLNNLTVANLASTVTTILGGSGNDSIKGGTANDSLVGGDGNDSINGAGGNDVISAGAGNDTVVVGGAGNVSVDAGAGNDRIVFAAGELTKDDTVAGGDGANVIAFSSDFAGTALADVAFSKVTGVQTLTATNATNTVGSENDPGANAAGSLEFVLNTNAQAAGINTISAQYGATGAVTGTNRIVATVQEGFTNALTIKLGNTVDGVGTSDNINAAASSATVTVQGAAGAFNNNDTLIGGGGASDKIVISADTAQNTAVLGAAVSGFESIQIKANAADASKQVGLTINSNDILQSGKVLTVDATELTNAGAKFTFDGTAETDTTSNAGRFNVNSGSGSDSIQGGAGNDTVQGNAGNDTVHAGLGRDSVDGGAGDDVLNGGTVNGGIADGNDTLIGGAGNDTLTGGAGADSLVGGDGNDVFNYGAKSGAIGNGTAADSLATNDATGFAGDTIDGFNAGGGTTATVVDVIRLPEKVAGSQLTTVTVANANLATLRDDLAASGNLNTALRANYTDVAVVTVSAGTAAGTYLVVNTDKTGNFAGATDLVVKLVNAQNLGNLSMDNFSAGGTNFFTPTAAFTVATNTGTLTNGPAASATLALAGGYTTIVKAGGFDATVNATGDAGGVTFDFTTGVLANAATADANTLVYSGFNKFTGSGNGDTISNDSTGSEAITLGAGANSVTMSKGGTDTLTTGTSGTTTLNVTAASGSVAVTNANADSNADDTAGLTATISGAATFTYDAANTGSQTDSITFSRVLTSSDKFLADDAADTTTLKLNAAQGSSAFTLAAANFTNIDILELGAASGDYNLVTKDTGEMVTIRNTSGVVIGGNVTLDTRDETTGLTINLSNGATMTGNASIQLQAGAGDTNNVTTGAGTDAITVTYNGSGVQTYSLGGNTDQVNLTTAAANVDADDLQLDGGLGTDTLALTQGAVTFTADGGDIKNFEIINVGGANQAFSWTTADADIAADTAVTFTASTASVTVDGSLLNDKALSVQIDNYTNASTYVIKGDATAAVNDTVTVTLADDQSNMEQDTFNLAGGSGDKVVINQNSKGLVINGSGTYNWAGVETLEIKGAAKTNASTQVITLDKDGGGISTVNASAATGGITVSLGDVVTAVTVQLGTGDDILNRTTAGSNATVTLNGGTDTINSLSDTATAALVIEDFVLGTDVWKFDSVTGVTETAISTTGQTITSATAQAATNAYILKTAAFQINGALTETGEGGAVEMAIINAGMKGVANTEETYFILDNGTSTGIYRAVFANIADANDVIDASNELTVTLVGQLTNILADNITAGASFV